MGKYPGGKWVQRPGTDPDRTAICLAVLRRDGFVSLDAAEKEGALLTGSVELPGGKLFVNVDAVEGELRVEALDKDGAVVAKSASITGDQLHGEVQWADGNIADREGQTISLRFTLRNARLYSYWLE